VDDVAYEELFERLGSDQHLPSKVADCLLAAADGPDALAAVLLGGAAAVPRGIETSSRPTDVPRVFLEEIAVTGFRGVADRARLPLAAGPGLTLVVGRNGSGKSSFAEGLELLLTGRNLRWDDKPKAWRDGWRNLHASGATKLEARFRVDRASEPLLVTQTLPADGSLSDLGPAQVSGARPDWDALGWDVPLARYRPLLSYNELGTMFSDRASELYEALSAVLGLEAFDGVQAVLRDARLSHQKSGKAEKETRKALKTILAQATDERAPALLAQIAPTHPDLDAVRDSLHDFSSDDDLAALQHLQRLPLPDRERITEVLARSAARTARVAGLERTDAERDDRLGELLSQALAFHEQHGQGQQTCPVCRTEDALDAGWSLRAQADIDQLRKHSADLRQARADVAAAGRDLQALFADTTPAALRAVAFDTAAEQAAWDAWVARRDSADEALALRDALAAAQEAANAEIASRDAAWRPVEDEVVRWLSLAREAARDKDIVATLIAAEEWMKALTTLLRSERLAPVVAAAQANWEQLRHESNVQLSNVSLVKVGQQRLPVFDVTVDGTASSAFGVMSQGELSALAVSIFLPRASLPESPFGFIVVDDPVQSMDPAKVDGLARVLADAAQTRQVIVFTHDDRLPQAVERMGIEARVMDVKRRAQSKVEIVAGSSPSERYIREAMAMSKTEDLPSEVRARVVPTFCRSAIEAACATRIRRMRYAAGASHAAIDEELAAMTSLNSRLAVAFDLSLAQGAEIRERVRQLGGDEAVTVVDWSRNGAHQLLAADATTKTRAAEKLVKAIEKP
jgi:energy-coupling factor transporter ATP-binding protein EcfA2